MQRLTPVEQAVGSVAPYERFLTVEELNESSRRLAEEYPRMAEHSIIGRSRNGDPIEMLRVGQGQKTALMFACPHPNEPIGAMTLHYLSRRLLEDAELRESLDYTWYLISCIDPDGTRLNEGWFEGPFTPEHYARSFYRPPSHQQIEWTFPFSYKNAHFDEPLPETQALMGVIDETRPQFMMSLHNAGFGGAYFYLSRPAPDLYPHLHRVVRDQGLPLSRGEPEVPYAETFDQAIYRMFGRREGYDYLEQNSDRDPAEVVTGGTSSHDYAQALAGTYTLVCEVPYYYDPRVDDTTPTGLSRREVVLEGLELEREFQHNLEGMYRAVEPLLGFPCPFRDSVADAVLRGGARLDARESWARSDPGLERLATRAEVFDNTVSSRFYRLLMLGMYLRLIRVEAAYGGSSSRLGRLKKAGEEGERAFAEWNESLLERVDCQVIPIEKLVRVQLGSALYSAAAVMENRVAPVGE